MKKETTKKTRNDLSLKKFLSSSCGSPDYATLRKELKLHLTDLSSLEQSDLVSEDLRNEARTISDAFEATTNGMHNPEVFSNMATIPDNSLLGFWKELIYAIKAFYKKDYVEMEKRLGKIEPDSSLILFKPLLFHLAGKNPIKSTNYRQKAFIDNIIKDRSFIRSVVEQIIECLEYDMEDLFLETTDLLLHDLNKNYKETAGRFAIWGIETASRYKYSPTNLITTCKKLFGNTEAYRLIAIALSNEEPDISLLFWIQSLISRLKSVDVTIQETAAYLTIISRSAVTIKNSSDNYYLESLSGLIKSMKYELDNKFTDISSNTETSDNSFEVLLRLSTNYSSLEENKIRLDTPKISSGKKTDKKPEYDSAIATTKATTTATTKATEKAPKEKPKTGSNKPIQLSLFD